MATKTASRKSTTSAKSAKTTKKTTATRAKTARTAKTSRASKAGSEDIFGPIIRRVKSTGWLAILESLVVGVLGVLLLLNPSAITEAIFYVVGVFLMIKGVYKIVNYFAVHGRFDYYNNDLLYGVIALVFGLIAVIFWEQLSKVIGVVVGVWMIYGALVRMNAAIKMHAANIAAWFYVLLLAMVMLALGLYMIVSVHAVMSVIAWMMIAAAVVSIVNDVIFLRKVDATLE